MEWLKHDKAAFYRAKAEECEQLSGAMTFVPAKLEMIQAAKSWRQLLEAFERQEAEHKDKEQ